ncbi:family 20 glycosylhydrolase [Chitinophaga nivalis]|uniref:beta-N-acetylhexosaminidase n=1 Tax=Chitinophaga nivalis TaxID=2991709 RepID=A0ABT3IEC7_9BACT|nr:family 20 glycosylhydrolase [Chitinophaga nivalis]MCW3467991.1 carbohydate-binding domain-containing protein [Chitinophaga nivalis]MCW3482318.1 carbohydate-binding domain-containing protein [Chitinophaga nivalis]
MTSRKYLGKLVTAALLFGTAAGSKAQQVPTYDVARLKSTWEVVENNYQGKNNFLSAFTFVNTGNKPFPAKGWQLYFNFVRKVKAEVLPANIKVEHINGDLYRFTPTPEFKGIVPGDSLKLGITGDAWAVNFTDAPAGLYLVWDHQPEKGVSIKDYTIRPSTSARQLMRYPGDKTAVVTPTDIFKQNAQIKDIPAAQLPLIFPTPASYEATGGSLLLDAPPVVTADPQLAPSARFLEKELAPLLGKRAAGKATIAFKLDASLAANAYTLEVTPQGIVIGAASNEGAFYGIQSLKSLITPAAWAGVQKSLSIPAVRVKDYPRFGYRAFMLDVARNFHDKRDVLRVLDVMALYKLNVLHFHFSDDEGWRLEIPSLPELTTVGAKRGHSPDWKNMLPPSYGSGPDTANAAGTGYFTRNDFLEILRYATERHIQVLPEIETPGHARAAVKAMEARYHRLKAAGQDKAAEEYLMTDFADKSTYRSVQYWNDNVMNVALPGTYRFLDKVVEELVSMYKEAGAPFTAVHMGGDEVPNGVFEQSPACLALMKQDSTLKDVNDLWYYYYRKVNNLVKARGLELAAWEEAGMRKTTTLDGAVHSIANPDFVNDNFQLNVWNNTIGGGQEDLSYRLANAGYKVILSGVSNFYFDMAAMKSFDEPGFYWGGFVDVDKPFYFIPLDYYKNSKVDGRGNPVTPETFQGKDRLTGFGVSNIRGIQGLLWSETIKSSDRMEYMLLPKLLGLAERAWAQDPEWAKEKDPQKADAMYAEAWSVFTNVLSKREMPRLDNYNGGYNWRIPGVGTSVEDGVLKANVQLPGLVIRYTTNGDEPTLKSATYTGPIQAGGKTVKLKVFNTRGRGSKTTTIKVPQPEVQMKNNRN